MFGIGPMGDTLVEEVDLLDPDRCPSTGLVALRSAELARMLPGADLAWLLEQGDPLAADDDALLETVAGWQRMAAWAAAGAARAAAELAERPSMNPDWPRSAGAVAERNVAGEELAMALSCSRMAARALVRDGRAFQGALAATGGALARGEIDLARARVLVRALDDLPVMLALAVQDAVLPGAPGRTGAQLGQDVARALLVADPDGAHQRHQLATRGRHLDRPRPLPDGMAGMWAVLPAADATRLDAGIDVLAQSARALGDPRTLDQLRADVFVDLIEARLAQAAGTQGPCACTTIPGGRDRRRGRRSEIRVTVPLTTLLGLSDVPGELAGYGAVTAEVARALARDGTWRRIVTDPLTGTVLDVGRTSYRPTEALAEHVRVRDQQCARPGCRAPAESCDLDHTVAYGRALGSTSAANLGPLCPRDHAVKTDGGFALAQVEPGVFEWTTPLGRRYRVTPGAHGVVERLGSRGARAETSDPPPF